jgi:glutamyl-Q tRNA(Asp) synthetase
MGLPTPRYMHVPVATNGQGEKLSKQTLAPAIGAGDHAALLAALRFLGQQARDGGSIEATLALAVLDWRPSAIAGSPSLPVPPSPSGPSGPT